MNKAGTIRKGGDGTLPAPLRVGAGSSWSPRPMVAEPTTPRGRPQVHPRHSSFKHVKRHFLYIYINMYRMYVPVCPEDTTQAG